MEFLKTAIHRIIARTILFLEGQGYPNIYERFPAVGNLIQQKTQETKTSPSAAEELSKNRYQKLLSLVGGSVPEDRVAASAVDLCLAAFHIPEFSALLQYYTGFGVTLSLAYQLESVSFPPWDEVRRKLNGFSLICPIDRQKNPLSYAELTFDNRVLAFLSGSDLPDEDLNLLCSILSRKSKLHPLYVYEDLPKRAAAHLKEPERIVALAGTGSKRFLAHHIGKLLEKDVLLTDPFDWDDRDKEDFTACSMRLIREALFQSAVLCICGLAKERFQSTSISAAMLVKHLILPAQKQKLPVILCTETNVPIFQALDKAGGCRNTILLLELAPLTYPMRKKVWQGLIRQHKSNLNAAHCAQRYHLLPGEISRALLLWNERTKVKACDESFHFSKLCYRIVEQKAAEDLNVGLGRIIHPKARLEDLIVSPAIRKDLDHIIASVNGSATIFEEWNLKEKYDYGQAVTALLCGPPGTGKTMSAHAVANALGIPLYQVNLSNIMDKYIGETEKRLEQAFVYAEKTNMVLFFDEADSLFGRRSEIADAKDKYANAEVSYLLQRIEQYGGVALMATNLMNNIDPAFLRRMKYVIRFQPPDEALRLAIWKSCLTQELPAAELDLPYLARQFEFSGGDIKNILLNACAAAICENEILHMRHILEAVKDEYRKMDRIIDASMWGKYAFLMVP